MPAMAESTPERRMIPHGRDGGLLRIAMLAPPWIAVPPPGYGGIEAVVDLLCEELVGRGHDVTLFAAPGSRSSARVHAVLDAAHPDAIGSAMYESDHVAGAFDAIDAAADRGAPFDVVHDHSGFTALAMAARVHAPVVHTVHGPLVGETAAFYARHGYKACLVGISRSQRESAPHGVRIAEIVPNPIAVDRWPLRIDKDDYLLWIGRMDPVKGAHRAIEAARLAGRRILLAGPVQSGQADYFREQIEPHIDGERVRYVGEVTGSVKQQLYARAAALLMPIRWREPFGMVMIEALACGTPVIAFGEGAANEIVVDGRNGFLVADEAEMARAVARVGAIDPVVCRESARSRFDVAITADGYEAVYRHEARIAPAGSAVPDCPPGRRTSQSAAARPLLAPRG
jgi:glycosyltransferase involved in cell wall biosynthesis